MNEDGWCVFSGLSDGSYDIAVTNGVCTTFWRNNPVVIRSPTGDPALDGCPNSSLEEGTFLHWKFQVGRSKPGSDDFFVTTGIPNQFSILPSSNTLDLIGIPLTAPSGNYFMRLGDLAPTTMGSDPFAGRAIYCLNVDASNADNRFWYAFAFQNGHEQAAVNPYFKWTVHEKTGTTIQAQPLVCDGCEGFLDGDIMKTFYSTTTPSWGYRSWTCQPVDLNNFISQEVCFVFEMADCEELGHYGYAYIDDICGSPKNPIIEFNMDKVFCSNVPVDAVVNNVMFGTKYEWIMSRVNNNGNIYETFNLVDLTDGFSVPTLKDIMKIYGQKNVNYKFDCNDKFRITLKVNNDCGGKSEVSKDFSFICQEYLVNYQDILACSVGNLQDIPITGTLNCTGCSFKWNLIYDPNTNSNSVGTYLSSTTIPFPNILSSSNVFALGPHYEAVITTPEGCIYRDTVITRNYFNLQEGVITLNAASSTTCSFDAEFTLEFDFDIPSDQLEVSFGIASNYGQVPPITPLANVPMESFDAILTSLPGTGKIHTFKPDVDLLLRGFDHLFVIEVKVKGYDEVNTNVIGDCSLSKQFIRQKDSPFFGMIDVYMPNTFSPNVSPSNGGILLYPGFSENVYEAWMKVWDRASNGLILDEHVISTNDEPINPIELAWDGKWKDKWVQNDTYLIFIDYQNCQVAPSGCMENQTIIGPGLSIGYIGSGAGINPDIYVAGWENNACVPDPLTFPASNIKGYTSGKKFECDSDVDCHHKVFVKVSN